MEDLISIALPSILLTAALFYNAYSSKTRQEGGGHNPEYVEDDNEEYTNNIEEMNDGINPLFEKDNEEGTTLYLFRGSSSLLGKDMENVDLCNNGKIAGHGLEESDGTHGLKLGNCLYATTSFEKAAGYGKYVYLLEVQVKKVVVTTNFEPWRTHQDGRWSHLDAAYLGEHGMGDGMGQFCMKKKCLRNVYLVKCPEGSVENDMFHLPEQLRQVMTRVCELGEAFVNEHRKQYSNYNSLYIAPRFIMDNFQWQNGTIKFDCQTTDVGDPDQETLLDGIPGRLDDISANLADVLTLDAPVLRTADKWLKPKTDSTGSWMCWFKPKVIDP